jgi:hypothetical protein
MQSCPSFQLTGVATLGFGCEEWPGTGGIVYPGTFVLYPYTDRTKMIVGESGSASRNQWLTEERNIYEAYKRAFGEEPPLISGVAIMTDTDNTGESATA